MRRSLTVIRDGYPNHPYPEGPVKRFLKSRGTWIVAGSLIVVAVGVATAWSRYGPDQVAYDPVAVQHALAEIPDAVRTDLAAELEEKESAEPDATWVVDDSPYELPSTRNPHTISPPLPDEMFEATLLIGTDASRLRADAIMYLLERTDGGDPILVSIPRDLFVENPCTQTYARINATLRGCGDVVTGPALLSVAVERFTGIEVDRFVIVDFDGFVRIIDAVGGVKKCFEYPTRDRDAELDVEAGCQTLDGDTALAFARSRKTLEFRNGGWRGTGADDFSRQEHQQELMFAVMDKVSSFQSISRLTRIAEATADAVTLSEGFSTSQAVALAWENRNIRPDDVTRIRLETKAYITTYGAYVLEPTRSFNELLAEVYPLAERDVIAAD